MTRKGLLQPMLAIAFCAVLATPISWADDNLQGGGRPRNGGGGGNSGGTRGGGRQDSPPPRRNDSPPTRQDSPPPRRNDSPPTRQDSPPPRRNDSPPTRQDSPPPRRNDSPPTRQDSPPPRRNDSPPTRQDSPPPRRNDNPPTRQDSPPRRNDNPPTRQDTPPPARRNETAPPTRRGNDPTPPTRRSDSGDRSRNNTLPGGRDNSRTGRTGSSDNLQTGRSSRSGNPSYGSNNNQAARRDNGRDANSRVNSSRERYSFPDENEIARRARRDGDTRPGVRVRSGYYHYRPDWRDDYFWYPHYAFTWSDRAVCSPWYLYPHLPGYLISVRINWNVPRYDYRCDDPYNWRYHDRYDWDSNSYALDNSIRDIVDLFENQDQRSLERLVPDRGDVVIRNQGQRAYSLSVNDFYDLLADAAFESQTSDYRITSVRRGRGAAKVTAEHNYRDPWGDRRRVYHEYTLRERYNRYEIVEFGTSDRSW